MAATAEYFCANKSCGEAFTARTADRARGWARFCCKSCKATVQEGRTGQYRAFQQRQTEEIGADESGWDGHKNAF